CATGKFHNPLAGEPMARILIIYATTDGHTAKVANRLGDFCGELGAEVTVHNARNPEAMPAARDFDAVIVAASVHVSGYQQAVRAWVRANVADLSARPNAFLSVCMGIVEATPRVRADLEAIVARFVSHTGWQPDRVEFIAGAIPYSRYGILKRWVMWYMSRRAGVPTSTDRDYEFTDWDALRGFAKEFVTGASGSPGVLSGDQ